MFVKPKLLIPVLINNYIYIDFIVYTVMQVSAYSSFGRLDRQRRRLDPASNEPLFTNCTRDFLGTLDYIFYTGIELTIQSITNIPTSLRSITH